MKINYIILLVIGFCSATGLLAQDPAGGEIEDAQIIIEKDKPLTLPKASRIYKRTNVKSITPDAGDMEYQITQPAYDFQQYIPLFSFHSFEPTERELAAGNRNFVKAGYGNYNSPLAQGYFGWQEENTRAGLWVNHESFGKGPVREEESAYGFTEVLLTGGIKTDVLNVDPKLYFQREGYFPYGYDPEGVNQADFDYQDRKIGASAFSAVVPVTLTPSDEVEISLKPNYQVTTMKFQDQDPFNTENELGISGQFDFVFGEDLTAGILSDFTYLDYVGGLTQNRGILEANPYVDYFGENLTLHGGLRFFTASGSLNATKSYLYLDLDASYQLSKDFGVFARLQGNLEPVTLNGIRLQNRYLDDSLVFLNQHVPIDLTGGVELNFAEKLLFKPYIRYKQTENKGLFTHSGSDSSRFTMVYDTGKFNEVTIGVESRYVASPNTTISAGARYTAYDPSDFDEAWYLPGFELEVMGAQRLADIVTIKIRMNILMGIKAPSPSSLEVISLDPIADLGIGAQYEFNDRIGCFVDFDNLFSQHYERYLNYPVRGLMAKGGFIYRF